MVSLIAGVVAVVLGIVGIVSWWGHFLTVFMGMLPALFILGGAVAVAAGFGTVKDKMKSCSKPEEKPEAGEEEKPEAKLEEKTEEKKAE